MHGILEQNGKALQIKTAIPAQHTHFMVPEAARTLKRFYLLQRELVLMQAGWMPGSEHWQSKLLLPEFLWQDSLVGAQCRERVLELRYPEREIDTSEDEPLLTLWRHFANAPHGIAFVEGVRLFMKPMLHRAFQRYLELTDALDDGPTVRILRQALQDIDEQLLRWEEAASDARTVYPDAQASTTLWLQGAQQLGEAIGDLLDTGRTYELAFEPAQFGGKTFEISRQGQRDVRFNRMKFAWPDSLDRSFGAGEGLQLQIRQAVHHVNEVWAAEMAAACIYDLAEGADPEFLRDAARWCYDEIRHCRMGWRRLREWGFDYQDIPLDSFSYDAGAHSDALTRLGIIFYFESTYIGTKSQRMRYFGEFGDRVSSHDMDFDWADEQIHTHYGTRWLKYFLEQRKDSRKPIEFRGEAEACVKRAQQEATDQDRAQTMASFESMMSKAVARAVVA
jgi:uncharacterized ferritin-like protein (DUF455 family)